MSHTYTVVHKDYSADTFEDAATAMLRDGEIWQLTWSGPEVRGNGKNAGYCVEAWEWDGHRLRVWFR